MTAEQAALFNILIRFLAVQNYDGELIDALILLGNACVSSAETAARLMQSGAAAKFLIIGGKGHSTEFLRRNVSAHPRYSTVAAAERSEAEILADIVRLLAPQLTPILGVHSTNCGANAVEARELLPGPLPRGATLLLIQDPTMQRRSEASFRRVWGSSAEIYSLAPFVPLLREAPGLPSFADPTHAAAWDMERFLTLILGEIPRLRDDENGYGPRGKDFIAHVDMPAEVLRADARLREVLPPRLCSRGLT